MYKLCLIVEYEKFYTSNPPEQPKRENEVGEGTKTVFQTHSAKLRGDLYPKIVEERGKHELKGENMEGDNKPLEPSTRKSKTTNRRFTRSMISLSIPRIMEQSSEPSFVEDNIDKEDESPPHETPFNDFEQEHSSNHGNLVVSPKRVLEDDSPLPAQPEHEARLKSPLNDEDSLAETLKAVKQSIKLSKQHKVDRLKDIEEARHMLKTELQQQKNELLMWVDRWQ